jgi:hypothetical protein
MHANAIKRLSLLTAYGDYPCHWRANCENQAASDVLLYYPPFDSVVWC